MLHWRRAGNGGAGRSSRLRSGLLDDDRRRTEGIHRSVDYQDLDHHTVWGRILGPLLQPQRVRLEVVVERVMVMALFRGRRRVFMAVGVSVVMSVPVIALRCRRRGGFRNRVGSLGVRVRERVHDTEPRDQENQSDPEREKGMPAAEAHSPESRVGIAGRQSSSTLPVLMWEKAGVTSVPDSVPGIDRRAPTIETA